MIKPPLDQPSRTAFRASASNFAWQALLGRTDQAMQRVLLE